MASELSILLQDWQNAEKQFQESILAVGTCVQKGILPTELHLQRFSETLNIYKQQYQNVLALAKETFLEEDTVQEASAAVWLERLREKQDALLLQAQRILNEFLSIYSEDTVYEKALQPYREACEQLLSELEYTDADTLQAAISAPKIFAEAVRQNDPDLAEEQGVFDLLEPHYSSKVIRGLSRGKYRIAAADTEEETVPEEETAADTVSEETAAPDAAAEEVSVPAAEEEQPAEKAETPEAPAETVDVPEEPEVEEEPEEPIETYGLRISPRTEYGRPVLESSGKTSTFEYKKDFKDLRSCLGTACMLYSEYVSFDWAVSNNIPPFFYSKGYLYKVTMEDRGSFLAPTKKFRRAMEQASVKKAIQEFNRKNKLGNQSIDYPPIDFMDEGDENVPAKTAAALCGDMLHQLMAENYMKTNLQEQNSINDDSRLVRSTCKINGKKIHLFSGTFFFTAPEHIRMYLDTVQKYCEYPYALALFATDDLKQARIMLGLMPESFRSDDIYVYAYEEDAYYHMPDAKCITEQEVRRKLLSLLGFEPEDPENVDPPDNEEPDNAAPEHTEPETPASEEEMTASETEDTAAESEDLPKEETDFTGTLFGEPDQPDEQEKVPEEAAKPEAEQQEETTTDETLQPDEPQEEVPSEDTIAAEAEMPPVEKTPNAPVPIKKEILRKRVNFADAYKAVCRFLANKKPAAAAVYLNSVEDKDGILAQLYQELCYALYIPGSGCILDAFNVQLVFENERMETQALSDHLKIAATLRAVFYNVTANDPYSNSTLCASIHSICKDSGIAGLAELVIALKEFRQKHRVGVYEILKNRSDVDNTTICKEMASRAADCINRYGQTHRNEKRYQRTWEKIYEDVEEVLCAIRSGEFSMEYAEYISLFFTENKFANSADEIRPADIARFSGNIDSYIDTYYARIPRPNGSSQSANEKMERGKRNTLRSWFDGVLELLAEYENMVRSGNADNAVTDEQNAACSNILRLLEDAVESAGQLFKKKRPHLDKSGIFCILETLKELISRYDLERRTITNKYFYVPLLQYGHVLLNDEFLPLMGVTDADIKGISVHDRVLEYANTKCSERSYEERLAEIFSDSDAKDDYGCAANIRKFYLETGYAEWNEQYNIEENREFAQKDFLNNYNDMKAELELIQAKGILTPLKKEEYLEIVEMLYNTTDRTGDYGFFDRLQKIMRDAIHTNTNQLTTHWESALKQAKNQYASEQAAEPLLKKAEQALNDHNFTVVEDIISRLSHHDFLDDYRAQGLKHLDNFLNNYSTYYNRASCKTGNFAENLMTSDQRRQLNRFSKDARTLASCFSGVNNSMKLKEFLESLGFPVQSVSVFDSNKDAHLFSVTLTPLKTKRRDVFSHVIAPFGSEAYEHGFHVMTLEGSTYGAERLRDRLPKLQTSQNTLILLRHHLDIAERRKFARYIKESNPNNTIILLDQVALAYLVANYDESINRTLMEITMPFSNYQPYSSDSINILPPEMFIGRNEVLHDLEQPNGANIICGGRQLGKTALLRMAETEIEMEAVPTGDTVLYKRAVYVSVKGEKADAVAKALSERMVMKEILPEGSETSDWKQLVSSIERRLNDKKDKIPYLLVLIDEAETFISSCHPAYKPIEELMKLQEQYPKRFKFVVAGLRNLMLFEKEDSVRDNSILVKMRCQKITPFTCMEARELLEVPLAYLGVRIPNEQLLYTILASTNYLPGLIHLYCEMMLETFHNNNYANFKDNETPPYIFTEEQIKAVLSRNDFNIEVQRKFMATLTMDNDVCYEIIALLIAHCYYSESDTTVVSGYTAEKIYEMAAEFNLYETAALGRDKIEALMDELCDLNILRRDDKTGKYMFARRNFLHLLDTPDEVENKILTYAIAQEGSAGNDE